MSDNTLFNILAPPVLSLVFSGICYLWARTTRRGKPLTSLQRRMVFYATIFALGMVYLILFQDNLAAFLRWKEAWIAGIVLWGVLVAIVAWQLSRVHRSSDVPSND
jgi:hypothetical protein